MKLGSPYVYEVTYLVLVLVPATIGMFDQVLVPGTLSYKCRFLVETTLGPMSYLFTGMIHIHFMIKVLTMSSAHFLKMRNFQQGFLYWPKAPKESSTGRTQGNSW